MGVVRFPAVTQTFVLQQMIGVLQAGHDLQILSQTAGPPEPVQPEVDQWKLRARHTQLNVAGEIAPGFRPAFYLPGLRSSMLRACGNPGHRAAQLPRRFDILHAQFGNVGWWMSCLKAGGWIDGPLVVSLRGRELQAWSSLPGHGDRLKQLWQRAERILPASENLAALARDLGCPPDKIEVVGSGLNLDRFPFQPIRPPAEGEPIRWVMIGRLVPKKGFDTALKALAELPCSFPRWSLDVVGSGEELASLKGLAQSLGIADRIHFHGALDQESLLPLLMESSGLICPSQTASDGDIEGIPNVIKEAMALGRPVVATRHGGIPELVVDGRTGLLARENDPQDLCTAFLRFWNCRARWPEMVEAARRKVEREFDRTVVNQQLNEIYLRTASQQFR